MRVPTTFALTLGLCLAAHSASAQTAARSTAPAAPAASPAPTGKYNIVADVDGEPRTATLTLSVDSAGKRLGHVVLADGQTHDMNVTVTGPDVMLTEASPDGDMTLKLQFHGDSLSGDWTKGDNGGTLKGSRAP
jgi:hypothetical protein